MNRKGTALIVMIGIVTILGALILSLTLRVKSGISDRSNIQKHAQAFMMMQAAAIYLNNTWDSTNRSPEYPLGNNRLEFNAVGGLSGGNCASLSSNYPLAANLGWYKIIFPSATLTDDYLACAVGGSSARETKASKIPYEVRYFLKYNPTSRLFSQVAWPTNGTWPTTDGIMWP